MSRLGFAAAVLLAAAAFFASSTAAQSWPAKPIRLIVPYPPGGSTDLLGRAVAGRLPDALGVQLLVENMGGAGGMLGSAAAARAAPDGYTFLLGTGATHGITLFMSKTVPYDPVRDFTPLTAAVEVPIALAVHPSVPAANARELIEYAKKTPGKLSYGSSGTGSPHHLSGELLKQVGALDIVHVPYKGAGPSMQDLLGAQIPIVFTTLSTALPHHRSGKIRILGLVEARRQPSVPEVPAIGESVPGYVMPSSWLGFFGPAKMPESIVARLSGEIVRAVHSPEVRAKLEAAGMPVTGTSAAEFAKMVREDIETFRRIIQNAGLKPE
ncbi:MAG: tripartite tricarboxylate transporter substrate binding protein [Burkholderiales bacterium]|nr:tripartite tricarboxylate transporter substrate binding protein [Burkholderiales bacterium]